MPMITVLLGERTTGTHTITHHPFVVGRDPSSDVPIENIALSRSHCRFIWEGGKARVEDMGSANGTLLNDERIESSEVKDGDEIKIGKYKIVFHQAEGEPAPPAGEKEESLAQMLEDAAEKRGPITDSMKTFQMSTDAIRAAAEVAGPSTEGVRAADVAGARSHEESSGGISKLTFYVTIGVGAGFVAALLVMILFLLLRG